MRGIAQYKASRVESAPPARIVLMLYQEAVHRLTLAAQDVRTDGSEWRAHLHHVRAIFLELIAALDHDAAPELCVSLERLYRWCLSELIEAGSERSPKRILGVLNICTTLLDGWQAVVP